MPILDGETCGGACSNRSCQSHSLRVPVYGKRGLSDGDTVTQLLISKRTGNSYELYVCRHGGAFATVRQIMPEGPGRLGGFCGRKTGSRGMPFSFAKPRDVHVRVAEMRFVLTSLFGKDAAKVDIRAADADHSALGLRERSRGYYLGVPAGLLLADPSTRAGSTKPAYERITDWLTQCGAVVKVVTPEITVSPAAAAPAAVLRSSSPLPQPQVGGPGRV